MGGRRRLWHSLGTQTRHCSGSPDQKQDYVSIRGLPRVKETPGRDCGYLRSPRPPCLRPAEQSRYSQEFHPYCAGRPRVLSSHLLLLCWLVLALSRRASPGISVRQPSPQVDGAHPGQFQSHTLPARQHLGPSLQPGHLYQHWSPPAQLDPLWELATPRSAPAKLLVSRLDPSQPPLYYCSILFPISVPDVLLGVPRAR